MAWLGTWADRVKVSISPTNIDGNLENFPFKLCISASSGTASDDISAVFDSLGSDANRKKIAVTTDDEVTQCYVEIESWDDASEVAWLHIKVPAVSSTVNTDLYLYYDPAQADNDSYVGDTGDAIAQNVWDSDFISVFHLAQDPSGGAGCILDSTATGNTGTPGGTMLTEDLIDTGYGKGLEFDGSDDWLAFSADADYKELENKNLTVEMLYSSDYAGSASPALISTYTTVTGAPTPNQFWLLNVTAARKLQMYVRRNNGADTALAVSAEDVMTGAYVYVWGQKDGLTVTCGVDSGTPAATDDLTGEGPTANNCEAGLIRHQSRFYHCIFGELRLSSVARSAAWKNATKHSLFDNLYSIEPDSRVIASDEFSLSANLSGARFTNFAHILSPAFLLASTLAGERIGVCLLAAPAMTGAFTFSPSATIIRAKDILSPVFSIESSLSASLEVALKILSQRMDLSFSFSSASQRLNWGVQLFNLINAIPVDGTFAFSNALNTDLSSQVLLLNDVLGELEGQLKLKNRLDNLVVINGTTKVVNVLEGLYSTGEYYLDESHGV